LIVVRAPFRASFLGGGSDIPNFYEIYSGAVLSVAIDRHMFLTGREMFDESQTLVKYSRSELVDNVEDIKHPIFREALKLFQLSGLDIGISSDIPAGSGLGSSSTFTVGLVSLLSELSGRNYSRHDIAKIACQIEIEILGEPIGKQDQYASAFGGLNLFIFKPNGEVIVEPLSLSAEDYVKLSESMFLVKLPGSSRSASEVLTAARENLNSDSKAMNATKDLAQLALHGFEVINRDGIKALPELLNEAWQLKLKANPSQSMSVAHETVDIGIESGASAAKLLGAGGGGFVLFLVDPEKSASFLRSMSNRKVIRVAPDFSGVKTIYKEKRSQ
jgi:D-glycero-alpha-D-manno-heptose-7-phosphate kinase